MYRFLAALPAILGFAGFVVYLLLRSRPSGDPVTLRIVGKLRRDFAERVPDQRLRSAQVERLLAQDAELRQSISAHDYDLLRQTLRQQFVISIFVYGACAILALAGVWLFAREANTARQLALTNIVLQDPVPQAKGLLVDLDDMQAKWDAAGDPEEIQVALRNAETNESSTAIRTRSDEHIISIPRTTFESLLHDRSRGGVNRLAIVIQGARRTFTSAEFRVHVGFKLTVIAAADAVRVAALIDGSSIPFYDFEALVSVPPRGTGENLRLGQLFRYGHSKFVISHPERLDWRAMKVAYLGPDDPRLVRAEIEVDNSLP
jgi:hypothetical protein